MKRSAGCSVIKDDNILIDRRPVYDRIIKSSYCTIIMGALCISYRASATLTAGKELDDCTWRKRRYR